MWVEQNILWKMTKKFDFNWRIPVPETLLQGNSFDKWTEVKKINKSLHNVPLFEILVRLGGRATVSKRMLGGSDDVKRKAACTGMKSARGRGGKERAKQRISSGHYWFFLAVAGTVHHIDFFFLLFFNIYFSFPSVCVLCSWVFNISSLPPKVDTNSLNEIVCCAVRDNDIRPCCWKIISIPEMYRKRTHSTLSPAASSKSTSTASSSTGSRSHGYRGNPISLFRWMPFLIDPNGSRKSIGRRCVGVEPGQRRPLRRFAQGISAPATFSCCHKHCWWWIFYCIDYYKDARLLNQLMTKHGSASAQDLDDKSLTICSGLDMVNINYLHVVCESAEQAKVRMRS